MEPISPHMLIDCPACAKSLSATHDMVGQPVECPFCKKHFTVTIPPPDTGDVVDSEKNQQESSARLSDSEMASLQGQLKENISQITELRGHVSRLNMELHRHELRMKSLVDRQVQLKSQIDSAQA